MDEVISVRRSFLNELRGFCNRFAALCDGCFCVPCSCPLADSIHLAKQLIVQIDNIRNADEERYYIENPKAEREARIIRALKQAGKPITSSEIRMEELTRQSKYKLLNRMVDEAKIASSVIDGQRYFALKRTNTQQHNKEQ